MNIGGFVRTTVTLLIVAASAPVFAQRRGEVRRARAPIREQYVVVVDSREEPEAVALETERLRRGRLRHVYRSALRGFSIGMSETEAAALAADPRIVSVEEDAIVHVAQGPLSQASPPWGLDRIDQRTLPLDRRYRYAIPTSPVTVHVVDTGVRTTHQEFGGRAAHAGDYVGDGRGGRDCNGHGTHVAATIAGRTFGVARSAVIRSHRVLDCYGDGAVSNVIAAVDAITADESRPAVANLSLSAGASLSLDEAIRRSIAAGITYVVAAGNYSADARSYSPARVSEAMTVGATAASDGRASFSNYGPVLDLFAPGASIPSAWFTSDDATATLSGTSMASPHVAGVAAAYLQKNPTRSPAQVRQAIVGAATSGRLSGTGTGSPNLLLYSWWVHSTVPAVAVVRPNGGERAFVGSPYRISWTASDPDGLSRIDVGVSTDGGATYSAVAGCTNLAASRQTCMWTPAGATAQARVRVIARDTAGDSGSDISNSTFSVVTGTPAIAVTSPNSAVNWGRGSMRQIAWTHNLGTNAYVRLELSRDGGATFRDVIADVRNSGATTGGYNWLVPGPNVSGAIVRVRWLDGQASDKSNTGFVIADPYVTVTAPNGGQTWTAGVPATIRWNSNLGSRETVRVEFSRDGGVSYSLVLLSSTPNDGSEPVTLPTTSRTNTGRIRLIWRRNSGVRDASNANFSVR